MQKQSPWLREDTDRVGLRISHGCKLSSIFHVLYSATDVHHLVCLQGLVREQLPRLRTEADRAALLANLICEAFGNFMGVVQESSPQPALQQLQAAFGAGPIPVGELIAAGLGGARWGLSLIAHLDSISSEVQSLTRLAATPLPFTAEAVGQAAATVPHRCCSPGGQLSMEICIVQRVCNRRQGGW